MLKNNILFKFYYKIKDMFFKLKEIRFLFLIFEFLFLFLLEEMVSFGMIFLMGGGRSFFLEILGESSLVLLFEFFGVLVVG